MIYLDTHVVVWLAGAPDQLSVPARRTIDGHDPLFISPMVELELAFLHETGRTRLPPAEVLAHLQGFVNLKVCGRSFGAVVAAAQDLTWTRDPFDRLITAQAAIGSDKLLTRDRTIRANYPHAIW